MVMEGLKAEWMRLGGRMEELGLPICCRSRLFLSVTHLSL